jgi:hypothetical protein
MSPIVAKLTITMTEAGDVTIEGTGTLLKHKAYAYGMLELAKEVIRGKSIAGGTIQPATSADMPGPH